MSPREQNMYRIVHRAWACGYKGGFVVQCRGILWGWNDLRHVHCTGAGLVIEYPDLEQAIAEVERILDEAKRIETPDLPVWP